MRRLNLAAMRACRSLDAWEIQGRTGRPRPAPTSAAGVEGREGGGGEWSCRAGAIPPVRAVRHTGQVWNRAKAPNLQIRARLCA